ncbi:MULTISPECIES: ABC transporter permease [unclassified Brevundimonas]|jgi:ABC-2 type transport system permease protein|uniref:ABC transporter permease n=1 Tax=unclassified Brevundimonas TaxID=2622653 RepID=UPI000C63984A|nr:MULTISPECIES: ABC transporter permease [unclassified Brevundimonas]MAL87405.1 ABC transporter permease [Brevundimonas sp.]HAV49833.1 ABC transporter permease [Brevundimonas sp.]|tara:strand:- start:8544 stop:9956 length:1413 start_codon:yes stop_codon:yes gene_type:complete
MSRTLLIARREYAAYAMTVGFWLSLLAFPMFAVLGGAIPILMRTSEPVRAVVLVEEGPAAQGLAGSVQEALRADAERRAARAAEAQEAAVKATGLPKEAVEQAEKQSGGGLSEALSRQRLRIVDTPSELAQAASGEAQEEIVRDLLTAEVDKDAQIDSVVFLSRDAEGKPAARVWSRRATDDTVEDFIRDALQAANRRQVFESAGIDGSVVVETERFRPDVKAFSPQSASGGEVSFKDRLPGLIGLGSAFLLWSLIITGASILLNSVMEEKSNKILEVLLSSASATEILTGKVLGVAMLTVTVLLVWAGIGSAGLLFSFPETARDIGSILLEGGMIWYFVAYAVGGYLMYAVLFAAIGAFCETPRDAQTLMGPIMMVLVIPIIVVQLALRTPDAPLVKIMSWVPFFTPFLMPARAPSDPPMFEIAGTMAGMFATALLMVWIAGRAFRAGALSDVKLSWKSFAGAIRGGGR